MTGEPAPISAEARKALERELAELRAERDAVAATLRDEDAQGDTADQADELQRVADLQRLDRRIGDIDARLRQAGDAGPPPTDVIGIGTTATVRFDDGTVQTVQLGEVAELDGTTLVTAASPLGRALLGHRVGDLIGYDAPGGHTTVQVLSLS
ncbi:MULTISPECIES: GreA/GreB family elongation factor [Streptomyces]|jgi:transcription elongation GreA/GreB family factor|uniref:Nucleoside diphosphate kinase regulator n=1 Tax=Streptomyces thermoviolaceus subsp. thermoviolaceus TaxID=66860 RepID=A0ABX0YPW9_STRTL|nr:MULTISPECIES: GreA/GreB family elongation factor [Streptomyces]MCM3266473.1 GreA/GreB family elongation factor [Streptomyces thermoviolaceus]NJP13356.1 nucleoside diphosphate kinase regulator [Streptomyces thermoviolaceus subsp. thermoviolaceus]RSR96816.1 nucleoside diphosphate kinase regulator [Streptomyces sp. WAC00469]WTD46473.1 GreA/GreB family elongation factor [Streptomyces thermoviolaceus]GHA77428.1 transcription inhibitor protein Gfh1 [Streptomyces thermoviolaceus subsp. thermoviola